MVSDSRPINLAINALQTLELSDAVPEVLVVKRFLSASEPLNLMGLENKKMGNSS